MSSFVKLIWRSQRLLVVPIPSSPDAFTLYERRPPFWARWALVLVSLNVFATSMAMLDAWTEGNLVDPFRRLVDQPQNDPIKHKEKSSRTIRTSLTVFYFGLGSTFMVGLLAIRARFVRSVTFVPKSSSNSVDRMYISAVSHPYGYGSPFALKNLTLMPSREERDMLINAHRQGRWPIRPPGAKIGGKLMPVTGNLAAVNMLKLWEDCGGRITMLSKVKKESTS